MIGNKSVFDENEFNQKYDTLTDIMLIEILYLGYFGAGNNVNWAWLKNQLGEVTVYDTPKTLSDYELSYKPQSFAYIKTRLPKVHNQPSY